MKYKHEKEIRSIAMLTLLIVLILGKLGKVKIQIMIACVGAIILILLGIYFIYKGLKLGGVFFFSVSLIGILVFLSYYYDSYILSVPIPGAFILMFIIGYKFIGRSSDKEKIKRIKKQAIIGIVLCSMFQILMIALLFVKH